MDETTPPAPATIVTGRACGACMLCCKLPALPDLNKPLGVWCQHIKPGVGCAIYPDRPSSCRGFHCEYLLHAELDEEWKPSNSRIILMATNAGNRMIARVDPQRPGAWRQEPFYSQIKRWSQVAARNGGQVVVYVGRRTIIILPDKDIDVGMVADDEVLVTEETMTPTGTQLQFHKVPASDPRAQALARQQTQER